MRKTIAMVIVAALCGVPCVAAAEWSLVETRPGEMARAVSYWRADAVTRVDGALEIEIARVARNKYGDDAYASTSKVALDCEWRLRRAQPSQGWSRPEDIALKPTSGAPAAWSAWSFDEDPAVDLIARGLCDGETISSGAFRSASPAAVLQDAVQRLGYKSAAEAFARPAMLTIGQAPFMTDTPVEASGRYLLQNLVWTQGARAVFVMPSTVKRAGDLVTGRSVWVVGLGDDKTRRVFAYRDFQADCRGGSLALVTTARWPHAGSEREPRALPTGPGRKVEGEGASKALAGAVCQGQAPLKSLASMAQLLAYVDAPGEDPAFRALRAKPTIHAGFMRWANEPDRRRIRAALPAGALKPGEKGVSIIHCVVTADYRLTACKTGIVSPAGRGLEEAHLALMQFYLPEKKAATGEDTAGRWVESAIDWSTDGSAMRPAAIPPRDMLWRRAPTREDIARAYASDAPAEATILCSITGAYTLSDCSLGPVRMSGTTLLNMVEGTKNRDKTREASEALGKALLDLTPRFVASARTATGEDPVGKRIAITAAWP